MSIAKPSPAALNCNSTSTPSVDLVGTTPTNELASTAWTTASAGSLTVASIANAAVGKISSTGWRSHAYIARLAKVNSGSRINSPPFSAGWYARMSTQVQFADWRALG